MVYRQKKNPLYLKIKNNDIYDTNNWHDFNEWKDISAITISKEKVKVTFYKYSYITGMVRYQVIYRRSKKLEFIIKRSDTIIDRIV